MARTNVFPLVLVASLLVAAPSAHTQEPEMLSGKRALTLDECVGLALRSNPGLLAARGQSDAARGRAQQARGALLPQITGSASTSRSWQEGHEAVFGTTIFPPADTRNRSAALGLSAEQSVVNLARWKASASANASQRAAEATYRTSEEDIVLATERAYFNYLKAVHLEEVAHENLKVGEEQLKLAEKRREVGIGVEADLLKARAQNAQDRLGVINAEKDTKVARTALCHVMGISLDTPLAVEDVDPGEPVGAAPAPEVDAALAERPELVDQRHRVRAAEHAFGAARAERLPTVGATFSYTRSLEDRTTLEELGGDTVSETDPYGSWRASLGLTLPIFRGGSTRGRINEARANLVAERELLEQAERDARLEIERATLNVAAAAEAIAVSREGVTAAAEDLRVSQGSYTHGLVPILNLVEAKAALVEAKNANVSATYDYRISLAELDRALGRGASKYPR